MVLLAPFQGLKVNCSLFISWSCLLRLVPLLGVTHVSYEIDMEPIWQERDCGVIKLLGKLGVETIPRISYTLWDPREVIKANGGSPPLTFGEGG